MTEPLVDRADDRRTGVLERRLTGFTVEVAGNDGGMLLRLAGELDMATAPGLRDALHLALEVAPSVLAVDLAELTFVDSTGIGVLLTAARRAEAAGCPFVVRSPRRAVLKVLRLTGVERVMVIEPGPPPG